MRYRLACGIIPISLVPNKEPRYFLVQGYGGYWGFPKGKKEGNETHLETAKRELFEETKMSCDVFLENAHFSERYRIPKKRGSDIMNKVHYFVGVVTDTKPTIQKTEIKRHGWFRYEDALNHLHTSRKKILEKVHASLHEKNNS
tara:strand:+ start:910 stop:1341 length:432 start_codon:yes stop_codon:yes gene_type:complete